MLSSAAIIGLIARKLRERNVERLVIDPVMVSKSGFRLLAADAVGALRSELLPLATVITPNAPEAGDLVRSEERRVGKGRGGTSWPRDWSSDVCSSDLALVGCNYRAHRSKTARAERGAPRYRPRDGLQKRLPSACGRCRRCAALGAAATRNRHHAKRTGGGRPRRRDRVDAGRCEGSRQSHS